MLPTDDKARKALPIFRGPLMYFPDAIAALAAVCKAGNDQHNPGEPLHWAREKSTEQMDTALRHMIDHGLGNTKDVDGMWHLAKAAWRLLAELQLTIERDAKAQNTALDDLRAMAVKVQAENDAKRGPVVQRDTYSVPSDVKAYLACECGTDNGPCIDCIDRLRMLGYDRNGRRAVSQ